MSETIASELNVLALNSGSSSLKFGLYRVGHSDCTALLAGEVESTGESAGAPDALAGIERRLADAHMPAADAIGHRIVHGGPMLLKHCLIDDAVLSQLESAAMFAPLHTPPALALIRRAQRAFPGLPQVACFDTSFHAGMPEIAATLPIPKELRAQGIRRYGFHGLSCESILRQLAEALPGALPERIIIAHLGNGASITAVRDGHSVDTSMGLTPSGGVIMGTRSGDLDPGLLIFLLREKRYEAATLEALVDHGSGLLGISGVSSDLRRLHEAAASNPDARLAIGMFCGSVAKEIAAMITVLDGLDLLVFTGGIGEHDAAVRATICTSLSWIGISLDAARNLGMDQVIQDRASRCAVRVLESQEDAQIARHAWALVHPADIHR